MKHKHLKAAGLIALLSMTSFCAGCSNKQRLPETIPTYCETVTLYQDRYVPVEPSLTAHVEIVALPPDMAQRTTEGRLYGLGAAYHAQRVQAEACNGQLSAIAGIQGSPAKQ